MSRRRRARIIVALGGWLGLAFTASGCAFGPQVLELSHGRYNEAVRRVDEEQLLRNLVHMRYNEIPLNLNVSSIAASTSSPAGRRPGRFLERLTPQGAHSGRSRRCSQMSTSAGPTARP